MAFLGLKIVHQFYLAASKGELTAGKIKKKKEKNMGQHNMFYPCMQDV